MHDPSADDAGACLREQFDRLQGRVRAMQDILEIISRSREEEGPVFDAILGSASRLCDAPMAGLHIADEARTSIRLVAHRGLPEGALDVSEFSLPIDSLNTTATATREGVVVHTEDLADDDLYRQGERNRVAAVDVLGARSTLVVPLLSQGLGIGCIWIFRREVRPYTEDEIALLQSFAAQAVIAIENTRQFRELQNRLDREAATREILQVISRSRDDEQPVFKVILENAARLCDAPNAYLHLCNAERTHLHVVAHAGTRHAFLDYLSENSLPLDGSISQSARAVLEKTVLHEEDLADDELYRLGERYRVRAVDVEGIRTFLCVPLILGEEAIGVISLYRRDVRRFDDRQVDLVQTFAAQAVIAIENVRQFKALESLNEELGDRVEKQVGEIERMGRLKRFLPAAVADTVLSRGSEKILSSHRALLGVLFCDIRGFTAFCETAEPEETIEVLQTYHEEMGKLINAHGAGVDHRMGDGIMVLFNDPLPCDDPAGDAVRLALAMRERMAELCKRWKRLGHRLGFGVGISLGYATVGMVGYEGRYDYTASGTSVNLAARLCDQAEDGEILLSPRAYTAIEDDYKATSTGEANLKGIRESVEVFRLLDVKDESSMKS